jgi:hypothetical protein
MGLLTGNEVGHRVLSGGKALRTCVLGPVMIPLTQ